MLAPRHSSLLRRFLFPPPQAPAPALVTAPSSTDSAPAHVISGVLSLLPRPASARPSRTPRPTASVATTAPPTSGTASPLAPFSVIEAISEVPVIPPSSSRATSVVTVGSEVPALASLHTSMVSHTPVAHTTGLHRRRRICNCPPKAAVLCRLRQEDKGTRKHTILHTSSKMPRERGSERQNRSAIGRSARHASSWNAALSPTCPHSLTESDACLADVSSIRGVRDATSHATPPDQARHRRGELSPDPLYDCSI